MDLHSITIYTSVSYIIDQIKLIVKLVALEADYGALNAPAISTRQYLTKIQWVFCKKSLGGVFQPLRIRYVGMY